MNPRRIDAFRCALFAAMCVLCVPSLAVGQLIPERLLYGVNQSIPVRVSLNEEFGAAPVIELLEPGTAKLVERANAAEGRVDLAGLFPVLWTTREPRVLYAQLVVGEERIGPALVLQPLLTPDIMDDGLTALMRDAARSGDPNAIQQIQNLTEQERAQLQRSVERSSTGEPTYSGMRVYIDRNVIMHTSSGDMVFRLRPDQAPNTVFSFIQLVEGGFYTDIPFHRIVATDGRGRPFIVQAGDPTATGFGGPGFMIDFERSALPHTFGVLSMARQPDNPNSAGSQFFICLGREACAPLDGQYVSFGELVDGAQSLQLIAQSPVGARDPAQPALARDRPLDPPQILAMETAAAPPYGTGPPPSVPLPTDSVDR